VTTDSSGSLQVSLVQAASGLEPEENRRELDRLTPAGADLVVFPEVFARDFGEPGSDVSGAAEPLDGPFAATVEAVASARRTTIVAGMFERSDDPARPYNTLVARGVASAAYRKIHLYDSFGFCESDRISAGSLEPVGLDLHGFRIGLMTCYDLRFPELARSLSAAGSDVIVVPAAWVAGPHKVDHWRTLVRARAIENIAYVVAVGQPGPRYTGHSMVVDPWGDVVVEAGAAAEVLHATLQHHVLSEARAANPSLANRRM
jgi:deaminated glutathione amidase